MGYYDTYNILKDQKREKYFSTIFKGHFQYWMYCFILSDADLSEKKELLEKAVFLFEKQREHDFELDKNYLLFTKIVNKEFDEAILLAETFSDFIKKQNQLEEKLHARKKQVAELQTTLGWFKYKTKNIPYRLKIRWINKFNEDKRNEIKKYEKMKMT